MLPSCTPTVAYRHEHLRCQLQQLSAQPAQGVYRPSLAPPPKVAWAALGPSPMLMLAMPWPTPPMLPAELLLPPLQPFESLLDAVVLVDV